MSKRSCLKRMAALLAAGSMLVSGASLAANKDVKFSLDFVPEGFHAPFYVALEKGFYAEEGLNVRISRGNGSGETVRKVATGEFDIGLAHMVPIISSRVNQNVEIRGVMQYMERDMLAIWVRDDGTFKTPKDFEGKTGATSPGNAQFVFFPALAKAAGFDASKVNWKTADAALLRQRVMGVAELIGLSRATLVNIRQNVGVALGLKLVFLVTTLAGLTGLWPAILADTGATVLVTLICYRLVRSAGAPIAVPVARPSAAD